MRLTPDLKHLAPVCTDLRTQAAWCRCVLTCGPGQLGAGFLHLNGVAGQLADVVLVDAEQDVLGLDVRVNDLALLVQVVQPRQRLKAHQCQGMKTGDVALLLTKWKLHFLNESPANKQ